MYRGPALATLAAFAALGVAGCGGGGSTTTFSVAADVYNPNTSDPITSNNGLATIQYSVDLATGGRIIPSKQTAGCLAGYLSKHGVTTIADALSAKHKAVLVQAGASCGVR